MTPVVDFIGEKDSKDVKRGRLVSFVSSQHPVMRFDRCTKPTWVGTRDESPARPSNYAQFRTDPCST